MHVCYCSLAGTTACGRCPSNPGYQYSPRPWYGRMVPGIGPGDDVSPRLVPFDYAKLADMVADRLRNKE